MGVHPTAEVSEKAKIGKDTQIWHQAQVREGADIGGACIIGKGVYIDRDVKIGAKVKIQNYASVYHGTVIEDGVFVGPYVCFTNDRYPRSLDAKGNRKGDADWEVARTVVEKGASLGAGSVILGGVRIGAHALVGAGSVVTKDVPAHALVFGNPARVKGYVCTCGQPIEKNARGAAICPSCKAEIKI